MIPNGIPTAELKDLFPGVEEHNGLTIPSHIFSQSDWDMPVALVMEQAAMAALCRFLKPRMVLEFGTAEGQGAFTLAANTPDDSKVFTVDLAAPTSYTERCLMGGELGACFNDDPTVSGKVNQVLRKVPDETPAETERHAGEFDFAHIDGDHTYEGVKIDTECAFRLAKDDAVFIWHDFYNFATYDDQPTLSRGVYPYLNELQNAGEITLRHILGTYIVVGRRQWDDATPGTIVQPGELPFPFGERIVRLWETGRVEALHRP